MTERHDEWNDPCVLCRIATGDLPAAIVTRESDVFAFVTPLSLNPGHTLIVPHRHVRDLYELPDELAQPVLSLAARVARAAKQAFNADGTTLRQHNEPAGGQEVFHFHLHVIPRFVGDEARVSAEPPRISWAETKAAAERMRSALV